MGNDWIVPSSGREPVTADDLSARALARLKAAGLGPVTPPPAPPPQPAVAMKPGTESARLAMTCAATGRPFVATVTIEGENLRLESAEIPSNGGNRTSGSGSSPPPLNDRSFAIGAAPDWACPHCRTSYEQHAVWLCGCRRKAMHCGGEDRNGYTYCACARFERRRFETVDRLPVRDLSPQQRASIARSASSALVPTRGR
jgi:hypothetical protein